MQQQVNKHLNRLMRLHHQKKQLQERTKEMLHRNVETSDELEAVENAESHAAVKAQAAGAVNVIN